MPIVLAVAVWLLAGQQAPPAPQPSVLKGVITDAETAAPIKDLRVTLVELDRKVTTAADGRFEFRDLAAGRYTVTVTASSSQLDERSVDVAANTVVDLTIALSRNRFEDKVTVTGENRLPPEVGVASQSALTPAGLQDLRGVAADDPMRAMQALPGVATGDDFQAQFSMRGSAFRHVGIVTDGLATPLLMHQLRGADDTGSVGMLNSDIVARGTLLAGPQPLKHGDWLGSTLEFDLREGSRERTILRGTVSGTSASVVVEGPLSGKRGSVLFAIRKSYMDWLVRKLQPSIASTLGYSDLQNKWVGDLTSRQQLEVLVLAGTATYQELHTTTPNGLSAAISKTAAVSVTWRYALPKLVVTQRASAITSNFVDRASRGHVLSRGDTRGLLWRGDVIRPMGPQWTLEGGARAESLRASQGFYTYHEVGLSKRIVVFEQAGFGGSNTTVSGWGQVARRTGASGIVAGVRASAASAGSWKAVSPWLLAERTVRGITFRAGANSAVQFPELDVLDLSPAGAIAPERARSIDAGLDHRFAKKSMRWGITGFYRDESDILRRDREDRLENGVHVQGSVFPTFASSLDGTSRGAELVFERRGRRGPNGWAGYTWSRTRYRDVRTGETFDGDFDQRHTFNAFVQQRLPGRWTASSTLRSGSNFPIVGYFAGLPTALTLAETRNDVRLPTYVRLDVRANRTFGLKGSKVTLFVEVLNVTNHRNLAQADGTITSNLLALRFAERVIPRLPSVGLLIEF